jgi:hypothetical protein
MRMHQILVPCVVVGLLAGAARAAILNPGFEVGDASGGDFYGGTSWGAFNDNWTTNDFARSGTQSLKVFGPFFQFGGAGAVQAQPAVPGTSYTASGFIMSPTGDRINGTNFAVVKLEFLNASNAVIGAVESTQFTATSDPADTWAARSATGVAPAGTVNAQIVLVHVQLNNPVTGGAVFFDDTDLSLTVIPEPALGTAGLLVLGGMALRRRRHR